MFVYPKMSTYMGMSLLFIYISFLSLLCVCFFFLISFLYHLFMSTEVESLECDLGKITKYFFGIEMKVYTNSLFMGAILSRESAIT